MPKPYPLGRRAAAATSTAITFVTARRPWPFLVRWVIAIIAIFVALVFGPSYIFGTSPYWLHPNYDVSAHLSGWLFFKEDSWHWPLLETFRMSAPDGASILFTDSIPLLAILAKLLGLGLLGNWHYFGLFVAGAFILNGFALLWALRQFGVQTVLGAAFAVVFACATTLHNIQFESFFAHFFIIFSIGFYAKLTKQYTPRAMGIFAATVLAASLVHPYLFAMSAALFLTTIATLLLRKMLHPKVAAFWIGGFLTAAALITVAAGYFAYKPTGYQEQLYATTPTFALDLTAPFTKAYTVDEIGTYLGLGFILLACIGLGVSGTAKGIIKRHWPIMAVSLGMILFAISTTIFFNGQELLRIAVPGPLMQLFEMFRASKRFIVPVFYIVAIAAFVLAVRQRNKLITGLVAAALVIQVIDTAYFAPSLYASARQEQPVVLDQDMWWREIASAEGLHVYPSYSCLFEYSNHRLDTGQWQAALEFYGIAAQEHKIANGIRTAKRTKDCVHEAYTGRQQPPANSVLVYLKNDAGQLMIEPPKACREHAKEFRFGIYCK